MAQIFRRMIKMAVPRNATIAEKAGKITAVWVKRTGEKVSAEVVNGKVELPSSRWYIRYVDHQGKRVCVQGFSDKKATERKAHELDLRTERIRAGDVSQASIRRGTMDLFELCGIWIESILDAGRTEKQAAQLQHRVEKILDETKSFQPGELNHTAVLRALAKWRADGHSEQTSNHYLQAIKSFTGWLLRENYVDRDPLLNAKPITVANRTLSRRALTDDEFQRLIESTKQSKAVLGGNNGQARAMIYVLAAHTGLRKKELESLTKKSFVNDCVVLESGNAKNRKKAIIPLPAKIVAEITNWVEQFPDGHNMFAVGSNSHYTIKKDLLAAGIPSKDDQGRQFDFHALRGQYASMLARAGVPIQHAQKLMRHSTPTLTMKIYTHLETEELREQADKL